jgi:phenylalanyl-tRNA synthetase beta chain
LDKPDQLLPDEPRRLGILMTGAHAEAGWQKGGDSANVDFFDLKGVVETLIEKLRVSGATYARAEHTTFHPGRSAALLVGGQAIGVFGEVHPLVAERFGLSAAPVLLAEIDLDALLGFVPDVVAIRRLPVTPPVLQDVALVVKQETPAAAVEAIIREAGGDLLKGVRLFDVYEGESIPAGYKSLAYSLTYQTDDRTLTDSEVATVHARIVRTAERKLDAKLRA